MMRSAIGTAHFLREKPATGATLSPHDRTNDQRISATAAREHGGAAETRLCAVLGKPSRGQGVWPRSGPRFRREARSPWPAPDDDPPHGQEHVRGRARRHGPVSSLRRQANKSARRRTMRSNCWISATRSASKERCSRRARARRRLTRSAGRCSPKLCGRYPKSGTA